MRKPLATIFLVLLIDGWVSQQAARAEHLTQCTLLQICYCVNTDFNPIIEDRVAKIHQLIAGQRKQGKFIGYISTPLSTIEGSYFGLNAQTAADVKARLEKQLGADFVWMLNPGANDIIPGEKSVLPNTATGADYMWMWTRILEGSDGLGSDFDWIYFVGPADFARTLKLTGTDDMRTIDAYYDAHADELKAVSKVKFRAYYGLRAAISFSYGSHDEWNVARAIDAKRRAADPTLGLADQLGIYFNGVAVAPALFEATVVPGNAGACAEK
jgi:hypothetical protein